MKNETLKFLRNFIIGIIIIGIITTIGFYLYAPNTQGYQRPVVKNKVISPERKVEPPPNKKVEDKSANALVLPDAFYQTIIDNNLFRPLGWQPETPQPKYRLLGTQIATNTTQHTKAFIVELQSGQLHIVQVNDRIGEQIVKRIEAKKVILQGDDQEIILQIEHALFF